jgi:hypothetical protein
VDLAPLDKGRRTEDGLNRLPHRFRAAQDDEPAAGRAQAGGLQIREQRRADRGMLSRAVPHAERVFLSNRKALARIDLDWHDRRHEALSRLADDSVPVHELQLLAGHASITTTERDMNARANSLAESMRQARAQRMTRLDEGGDHGTAQLEEGMRDEWVCRFPIVSHVPADARSAFARSANVRKR